MTVIEVGLLFLTNCYKISFHGVYAALLCGETGVRREKKTSVRPNHIDVPSQVSTLGVEPGASWWEARALTSAPDGLLQTVCETKGWRQNDVAKCVLSSSTVDVTLQCSCLYTFWR